MATHPDKAIGSRDETRVGTLKKHAFTVLGTDKTM